MFGKQLIAITVKEEVCWSNPKSNLFLIPEYKENDTFGPSIIEV